MSDIIPNVVVSAPSQLFTLASKFQAASNGKIYIGKIDTDPTIPENQIQVYLENEDGSTIPVAQPLIINQAGLPVYNGQIAKFVTVEGHSMAVYDSYGVQQFYYDNILKYSPDQFDVRFRAELAAGSGADLIGTNNGETVNKNLSIINAKQTISVTDFGGIGDYDRETKTGTDNTKAFQDALDYCGIHSKALFVPQGHYLVNGNLTCNYAIVMYGEGANGASAVNGVNQKDSPFIGSAIVCNNSTGIAFKVQPVLYQFGGSINGVAFVGHPDQASNPNHEGVMLSHVGLQGYSHNMAISGFGGRGLIIGYLQDYHFISLFLERCGTDEIPAIDFVSNANYIYFQDCLLLSCHYFLRNKGSENGKAAYYIFWNSCHIEHGDYGGKLTDIADFCYKQPSMQLMDGHGWLFTACTFVPVSNETNMREYGFTRFNTPYFLTGTGDRVSFVNCRFNAPLGTISAINLPNSANKSFTITSTMFIGCDPYKPVVDVMYAKISDCDFILNTENEKERMFAVNVRRGGGVVDSRFSVVERDGIKRTVGHLVLTGDDRYEAVYVSNNTYPSMEVVAGYVHRGCTISGQDGGAPYFMPITNSGILDMSNYPPSVNFRLANNVNITDVLNAQYGRRIVFITNGSGCVISRTGNIHPKLNVDYNMSAYLPAEFMCLLETSGERRLFQLAG